MKNRQSEILKVLEASDVPVSASSLAKMLDVSRQSIVGDIALLRASGSPVLATPRGYMLSDTSPGTFPFVGTIACSHDNEGLAEELYTIVDLGGTAIDVSIEHAIYGELSGKLNLSSRYDVDQFLKRISDEKDATPISSLTGGIHLHHIGTRDAGTFTRIHERLTELGIAIV